MFGQLISFFIFWVQIPNEVRKNVKNERNERRPLNIKMIRETLKIKIVIILDLPEQNIQECFVKS